MTSQTPAPVPDTGDAQAGFTPAWLAVASLALSTFASVTTEFLPIGLLGNIADSLNVTKGAAGLMVTMPGITAAFTGPLLITMAGRLDRGMVLKVLSFLLVLSNVLAASAPNLATMLFARALLGLCVGGFWTFAPSATAHLVPAALVPRAMSYVLMGISVATVAGVPAGAFLGNLAGWRIAFVAVAMLSAGVLALQLRVLPGMPPARASSARDLLAPLKHGPARMAILVALLLVCGHFVGYTYLAPMLENVFGLSHQGVTASLLGYGFAGLFGTFLGGRLAERSARGTALLAAGIIGTVLISSALAGHGPLGAGAAALAWGMAFGFVPVSMTTWMLTALPSAPDAGQALLVTAFQVAISFGAFVGGVVVDSYSIVQTLLLGGALAVSAALIIIAPAPRNSARAAEPAV